VLKARKWYQRLHQLPQCQRNSLINTRKSMTFPIVHQPHNQVPEIAPDPSPLILGMPILYISCKMQPPPWQGLISQSISAGLTNHLQAESACFSWIGKFWPRSSSGRFLWVPVTSFVAASPGHWRWLLWKDWLSFWMFGGMSRWCRGAPLPVCQSLSQIISGQHL